MFLFNIHQHEWSEWHEIKHYWGHTKEIEHYCKKCGYREYKLLNLLCPQLKIKGEYCHWCKKYAEIWEKRDIDFTQQVGYDAYMKTEKRKLKIGRPPKLERNIAMALEQRFYGFTYDDLAKKYKMNKRTAWEAVQIGEKYIDLEKVKKAVGDNA